MRRSAMSAPPHLDLTYTFTEPQDINPANDRAPTGMADPLDRYLRIAHSLADASIRTMPATMRQATWCGSASLMAHTKRTPTR